MNLLAHSYPNEKHVALSEIRLLVFSVSQDEMWPGLAQGAGSWTCSPAAKYCPWRRFKNRYEMARMVSDSARTYCRRAVRPKLSGKALPQLSDFLGCSTKFTKVNSRYKNNPQGDKRDRL